MKKLIIFITIFALCFTFSACDIIKNNDNSPEPTPSPSGSGTGTPSGGVCSHDWAMVNETISPCGEEIDATFYCKNCSSTKTEKIITAHTYDEQRTCTYCAKSEWEIAKVKMQAQSYLGENTNYKYTMITDSFREIDTPDLRMPYIQVQEKNGEFYMFLVQGSHYGDIFILKNEQGGYDGYELGRDYNDPDFYHEDIELNLSSEFLEDNPFSLSCWLHDCMFIRYDAETNKYFAKCFTGWGELSIEVSIKNGLWDNLIFSSSDGLRGSIVFEYGTADFELPENIPSN